MAEPSRSSRFSEMNQTTKSLNLPLEEVPQAGAPSGLQKDKAQPVLPETRERKLPKMVVMLIAQIVGILIGVIFKALNLFVPVPHDFAGIVGLIGMFVGSALVDVVAQIMAK
jgi:XapX domain-containing protein